MTAEEFATLVEAALAKADDADLAIEVQIEVLERIVQAMKGPVAPKPFAEGQPVMSVTVRQSRPKAKG